MKIAYEEHHMPCLQCLHNFKL